MVAVNASLADYFVENHRFDLYVKSLMVMCIFYTSPTSPRTA
jgi:hypothetical protein